MRISPAESQEKWVFRLDSKKSLTRTFHWMLGQLSFLAVIAWGIFSQSAWGMFFAALSASATLLCAFMVVFTIARRQHSRIEIVDNELLEYFGARPSQRWNLLQVRKLSSFRFTKSPNDHLWLVRYDEGSHVLILKREWSDFDTLLGLIEERSNLKFTDEVL